MLLFKKEKLPNSQDLNTAREGAVPINLPGQTFLPFALPSDYLPFRAVHTPSFKRAIGLFSVVHFSSTILYFIPFCTSVSCFFQLFTNLPQSIIFITFKTESSLRKSTCHDSSKSSNSRILQRQIFLSPCKEKKHSFVKASNFLIIVICIRKTNIFVDRATLESFQSLILI